MTLPALGESVTEGTVTRWLKQVGDEVAVDEPLLEVSTDKVDTEIPSPVAGTLLEIKVDEDETVEVGAELAMIGSGDAAPQQESAPAQEPRSSPSRSPRSPSRSRAGRAGARARAGAGARPAAAGPQQAAGAARGAAAPAESDRDEPASYVTPLVRKMAAQHGVDLATVTGTGVGGRIRKQDVLDAANARRRPRPPRPAAAAAGRVRRRRPPPRP